MKNVYTVEEIAEKRRNKKPFQLTKIIKRPTKTEKLQTCGGLLYH